MSTDTPTYTITKTQIESYKVRCESFYWADITVDANGNKGRIQIASDFGSWGYFWGSCGKPFKEFLQKLNLEYVARKFGASNFFDRDATIDSLKDSVKNYTDDKDLKSALLVEIDDLNNTSGEDEFVHVMHNCDKVMEMENHCPEMIRTIEPGFKRFWNEIWPVFIDELKNEANN